MLDRLISLNALRKEVERNFDMQNLYLPVHILDVAEDVEEGIVRCRNCIHGENNDIGEVICDLIYGDDAFHSLDWFCADGVKRE